jgi:hypothetical protein
VRHPLVQKIVKAYDTYEERIKHESRTENHSKMRNFRKVNYKSEKIRGCFRRYAYFIEGIKL